MKPSNAPNRANPIDTDESVDRGDHPVITWEQFNSRSIHERLRKLKARLAADRDDSEYAFEESSSLQMNKTLRGWMQSSSYKPPSREQL